MRPAPSHDGQDELGLIFTCCDPRLPVPTQLALTLRLVCDVSVSDISHVLVMPEDEAAALLDRAEGTVLSASTPYRVPKGAELLDRLDAVLGVVHLLYTMGHSAPSGAELMAAEPAEHALWLAQLLADLMPDEPEVRALLALILIMEARSVTRTDGTGRLLTMAEQNRVAWDRAAIEEGRALIAGAFRRGEPGRFTLQAAIAAVHATAPSYDETDWPTILDLYDKLYRVSPTPVVALNRTVAVSMVHGPAVALDAVAELETDDTLAGYHYLPAVKADLLRQLGRDVEAATAYRAALALAENEAERAFLTARLAETAPAE
ncbi:RNA polymerase sigma factor [Haloechinothrix halophila]|uniref:RNA polymerase sigma factor n=1 Tax=Haloechinothrix halophila TaxID=1069073 RepID=UPI000414C750|nr:DUF6596 domain-containing protein [Haloechinothrix halophila]